MSNILRIQSKAGNFTIVANEPLNDPDLSWKAKGLLVYLLSKPNNWRVSPEHLRKASLGGRDAIYATLKELMEAGYIIRRDVRNPRGRVVGVEYIVLEGKNAPVETPEFLPFPEKPDTVKPDTEKPDTEKPHNNKYLVLVNTDSKKELNGDKPPQPSPEEILYEAKVAFCKKVIDFVKKNPNKYPKAMYFEFCRHWLEEKENGKKRLRFQKEEFFSMGKRLATWFGNTKDEVLTKFWEAEKDTPALNVQLVKLIQTQ